MLAKCSPTRPTLTKEEHRTMEAGRGLICPPPPSPPHFSRTHHLRSTPSSTPALVLHDQACRAVTSLPTTSIMRHFPASVLSKEQRDDHRTYVNKDEKMAQATLDRRHMEGGLPVCEEREKCELDHYLKYLKHQLHYLPGFCSPLYTVDMLPLAMTVKSILKNTNQAAASKPLQVEKSISNSVMLEDALTLAKRAMTASRKAALLAKTNIIPDEFDQCYLPGSDFHGSAEDILIKTETMIRSRKLLERRSKKRKVPKKQEYGIDGIFNKADSIIGRKKEKTLDSSDPLRFFLWGPETKQLLTVKEEKELFVQIQDLLRLEEIKHQLQLQFNREPSTVEWAQAVGMSCQVLQSCLYSGRRSREKVIYANFRLVVHVAKQYEGKGLCLQDLLQEGSKGLMKSVGKFKPKVGCRFPTYAYWWIRQSIRKSIFQHSRTIRLPENVFALLKKIKDAKRLCIQESKLPTNEEVAKCVGISVTKLESLLFTTKNPVSIQGCVWLDQDVTFQEITADPAVEIPDLSIAKKMMRQHVRNLLGTLTIRERQIIQLRFGIHDNKPKSLTDIGNIFGLSKERIRQLETRAFNKLKGSLQSQGLGAYIELLT